MIKDQSLKEISNKIIQNNDKLYHLSLNFIGLDLFKFLNLMDFRCFEITDEEIKSLGLAIATHLKKLKHITLNLIGTG